MYKLIPDNEPREVEVPAQRETFEAQVLVITKPYKKMVYPLVMDASTFYPLQHTYRVIDAGRYKIELVPSQMANGKPTLIIYEEEKTQE